MSAVPKPYKWDMIPEMAGMLVHERKNELCKGGVLSLFCFIKTIFQKGGRILWQIIIQTRLSIRTQFV